MSLKPNKAQRAKLLSPELRDQIQNMPDDVLLAAHDLMHEQMEIRHGSNKRADAKH